MSSMNKNWIISDTHFGHNNALKFTRSDGKPLRPFSSVDEMDRTMIEKWNAVVADTDRVYHLGDVVINKKFLEYVRSLKGRKIAILGNHDEEKAARFLEVGFEDVRGSRDRKYGELGSFIATHIPIHPVSIERFRVNFHGHMHSGYVDDPRYLCVSVEHTNYAPITLEEAFARVAQNEKQFEVTGHVIDWSAKYV